MNRATTIVVAELALLITGHCILLFVEVLLAIKIGYGIDIGEHSIKLVELRKSKAEVRLASVNILETKITPSQSKDERETATATALGQMLGSANIGKTDPVTIAAPGLSAFIRYVKLPPVTSKRLDQIIGYEAQQQVPFPLDEVIWNYQILKGQSKSETNVILVAIKGEVVEQLLGMINAQGLSPFVIEHRGLGLYNCVAFNREAAEQETKIIIDIGARATDLSIEREGELCWTRSARIGGEDITEVIQKTLHISFEEAEKLKIEKGVVYLSPAEEKSGDETSRRVWEAMQPVVDELLTELQRSISYFHSQLEGTKIDRILLTGGSSRLRNLDRLISEQLGAEVKTLDPLKNITYSPDVLGDEDLRSELGVAIGLAIRSIEEGFSTIDLLPKIVISRRQLQKKKVYLVLSGLSMGLLLTIFSIFATQNCNTTQALLQNISAELTEYEKFESQISAATAKQKKTKSKIDILSNLVAAREYWPIILLELSRVLPDNTHLRSLKVTDKTANVVELKGRTTNFDAVTNLIARLEKSPLFGAVEVVSATPAEGKTEKTEEPRRRGRRGRETATSKESRVAAGAKQTGIDFVLRVTLHGGMQMVEGHVESKLLTGEQRPGSPEGM